MRSRNFAFLPSLLLALPAAAATFYVSPKGDDAAAGQSAAHPWKSCQKIANTAFQPGDAILFERGGEWRERLQASSDGAAGKPITYDAYGKGAKPKFWGSDPLENAKFQPAGPDRFSYPLPARADAVLQNHAFIASTWEGGTLTLTTPGADPRTDRQPYTACTRGNVLFSNRKSHLVFRNLICDETAGQITDLQVQGYGVRIEGSTDVLVESCEAYHCGRHHFAAINSTEFIGRHLVAAYVQPNTPGDNTAFVTYADANAPVPRCTATWEDISAAHLENGHGGESNTFLSHGDHLGLLTLLNSTATTKISLMSSPVIIRHTTLREYASIENFGAEALIDGVTLLGSSAIDQWGAQGTIQNCLANLTPSGNGPTGYSAAILCRDKAKDNVVRFNTLVTNGFRGLYFAGGGTNTRWYGNIFVPGVGATVSRVGDHLAAEDVAGADYNFYAPGSMVGDETLEKFQARGLDAHSRSGDPKFVDPAKGDFHLQADSPARRALPPKTLEIPPADAAGAPRPPASPADLGAWQSEGTPTRRP